MRYHTFHPWVLFSFLPLVSSSLGQQAEIRVQSLFEPEAITLSRQTSYKVIIHGSQQSPEGQLPAVDGLDISSSPNLLRRSSFNNGRASHKLELSLAVKARRIGMFEIPTWNIVIGGKAYPVPPANLRVFPPNEADVLRERARKKKEADLQQALFLELKLPSVKLYEGQTILGSVDLYIWEKLVTIRKRFPVKIGPAFSQSEISSKTPVTEKRGVSRFNKRYTVLSWPIALTAAMTGSHNLKYEAAVEVRGREPRRIGFPNDPFDILLRDSMMGFGRTQVMRIPSETLAIEVSPLPMDGRPTSFRGAIGSFETSTVTDTTKVTVGDPVRVTFSVSGKGNFGVMPAPEMPSSDKLKVGPPAFSFKGNESTKFEGIQSFEYVVTPLSAGRIDIPAVPFSYFDPDSDSFVTASGTTGEILVELGETWVDPTPTSSIPSKEKPQSLPSQHLFQTESEPGEWQSALRPYNISRKAPFWYVQLAGLCCFAGILGWRSLQNQSVKDSPAKRIAKLRNEMKTSVRREDASGFLRAATGAIREHVGTMIDHESPEALAKDEVLNILRKNKAPEETLSEIQMVMEIADTREFAAAHDEKLPLKDLYRRVKSLLRHIKPLRA